MKRGLFRGEGGGLSTSRIFAGLMIAFALMDAQAFILIGVYKPDVDLMKIATALGVLVGSLAGTAMTFLFFQKKNEIQANKTDNAPTQ
jgi:hypothetical protein